jgi:hypothetical protein
MIPDINFKVVVFNAELRPGDKSALKLPGGLKFKQTTDWLIEFEYL